MLLINNILISIFESNENDNTVIYGLNQNNNFFDYFTIPVSIIQRSDTRSITLIFRIRDLYLQGFININNNTRHYYHFSREVQDDLISYPNINSENTHDLGYTGHYNNLMGQENQSIYWQSIASSFFEISNMGPRFESQRRVVQAALGRIVLVTSEALRFRAIYNLIIRNIIFNSADGPIYLNPPQSSDQTNIRNIVTNWQSASNNIIDIINYIQGRFVSNIQGINRWFYDLLSTLSINTITQIFLDNSDVMVVIGGLLMEPVLNCDRRKARSINNYIKNKYCDAIKGQEQNYPLKNKNITTIKILDENTKGNNLSKLDMYIGTNEGLYFKKYNSNLFVKVDNVDDKIVNITVRKNGNNYVVTDKEEIYFLRTDKFSSYGHLIGEKIFNAKSLNLEKEIKLYYNNVENPLHFSPDNSVIRTHKVITFDLGKINPIDYFNKLEFLGDVYSDSWGVKIKWGSWIYDGNPKNHSPKHTYDLGYFMKERYGRDNKFHDIIKTEQVDSNLPSNEIEWRYTPLVLQDVDDYDGSARVYGKQKFGLTCYFKNEHWYLQVIFFQYTDWRASFASLDTWLKIGNGIRLYND